MRRLMMIGVALFIVMSIQACQEREETIDRNQVEDIEDDIQIKIEEYHQEAQDDLSKEEIDLTQYEQRSPIEWGENVTGVKTRMNTEEKVIALTFDACGGPYGNKYDEALITFLREEQIPATLFINERWIMENEQIFLELADDPLFQIENHGTAHVPLSVSGQSAWGIEGTADPIEVKDEVLGNQETIQQLTGREPTLFRSGTAFYDEIAVEIVNELGLSVVNFDILGDAGATFSAQQVHRALLGSTNGSIALLHMNQPSSGTAEGVQLAVQDLINDGYVFVTLDEYPLQ